MLGSPDARQYKEILNIHCPNLTILIMHSSLKIIAALAVALPATSACEASNQIPDATDHFSNSEPIEIPAGEEFDGLMARYDRGPGACKEQDEGGTTSNFHRRQMPRAQLTGWKYRPSRHRLHPARGRHAQERHHRQGPARGRLLPRRRLHHRERLVRGRLRRCHLHVRP